VFSAKTKILLLFAHTKLGWYCCTTFKIMLANGKSNMPACMKVVCELIFDFINFNDERK
jgi:hypothetical protein